MSRRVKLDREGGQRAAQEMRDHPATFGELKAEPVRSWRDTLGLSPQDQHRAGGGRGRQRGP